MNPAIYRAEDSTTGPMAVSPVQLSTYDKEMLKAIPECRKYLDGGGKPKGRVWKLVKRLAKKVWMDEDGKDMWVTGPASKARVLEKQEEFQAIMRELHDGMGHHQLRAVLAYFTTRYWIPAAPKLIESYIRSCHTCQKYSKNNILQVPGYTPQAADIFSRWSIDFAGPFPPDTHTGDRYAIFAVDFLSRWVEARATNTADAATAATFIYEQIVCRYGPPASLHSDNGSHFVNEVIDNLNQILKIQHHRSTPYYPQSNGRVERVIGTIKGNLKKLVDETGTTTDGRAPWTGCLAAALWTYRCTPHSVTRVSPAFLVFGKEIPFPGDEIPGSVTIPETLEEHRELVSQRIRFISDIIPGIRDEKKTLSGGPVGAASEYHVGDMVWLWETKYDGKDLCPVFAPRWTGPFQVWEIWDKGAYRIRSVPRFSGKKTAGLLRNPVNGNRLKPYVESEWNLRPIGEVS